jgi:hypothetical protein
MRALKIIRQIVEDCLFGAFCGGIGGLVAGPLLMLIVALPEFFNSSSNSGESIGELFFPFLLPAALMWGGLIGCFIGGLVGATLILTKPYLKQLSQVVGVTITLLPIIIMAILGVPFWTLLILISGATLAGFVGGKVAYRCYQSIFPDTAVPAIS